MRKSVFLFFILGGLVFIFLLNRLGVVDSVSVEAQDSKYGADPSGPYLDLELESGLFNGGEAAPWDLSFLDNFKIFGPEQRAAGHKPQQPINFSHITHVQQNGMDCQYCHWSVSKSAYAAIPEVETCVGCHKVIRGSSAEQQQEISKLLKYFDENTPIPWQKVHVMPNYVHFNHKRHVKAGVACHECHGQVPNMKVVERVSSMKMGWCIECHRDRGASIDCYTCHY